MNHYFISDLHLTPDCPQTLALFYQFIEQQRDKMASLYILGDFFEYWVGDDHLDSWSEKILSTLQSLDIPLFFIHGNRDFLLSANLLSQFGIQLLQDNSLIQLAGKKIILAHGDQLCTDDLAYQEFRQMVRSLKWQKTFLAQPRQQRLNIVNSLRKKSQQAMQEKTETIMDVNPQAVEQLFQKKQAKILIHGHTHRPGIYHYDLKHFKATRYILGDWHNKISFLKISKSLQFELVY